MNMVRHCIPLFQIYPLLAAQIPKDLTPNLPVNNLFAILRQNEHMILAFPRHMCLTFPIFHDGPSCDLGPSSGEDRLSNLRPEEWSLLDPHQQSRWINHHLAKPLRTHPRGLPRGVLLPQYFTPTSISQVVYGYFCRTSFFASWMCCRIILSQISGSPNLRANRIL